MPKVTALNPKTYRGSQLFLWWFFLLLAHNAPETLLFAKGVANKTFASNFYRHTCSMPPSSVPPHPFTSILYSNGTVSLRSSPRFVGANKRTISGGGVGNALRGKKRKLSRAATKALQYYSLSYSCGTLSGNVFVLRKTEFAFVTKNSCETFYQKIWTIQLPP